MVTLTDIQAAAGLLEGKVIRTPLVHSPTFSAITGAEVYLKLECMQKAGSFKVRGATCRILLQRDEIGPGGVIAASAGNHAQGVAVAASMAGVPATIVMPTWVSLAKQEATIGYGARVILAGESLEESIGFAQQFAMEQGLSFIHPYDDPMVIAGQGTIGLEILSDLPDVECVVVPIGGGGLIAGIATALTASQRKIRVLGVQAEACPSAREALRAGQAVTVEARPTIADGIRVKRTGELSFPIIQKLVDEVVLVDEEAIVNAVLALLERKKVLAEGAGAAPLAALLSGGIRVSRGEKVAVVISGGNMDAFLLERVLKKGLYTGGRMVQIRVVLEEGRGSLPALLDIIAKQGAVVSQIFQERSVPGLPVHQMRVTLELEVRDLPHRKGLIAAMRSAGYPVEAFPED
ncbi:MAG TPA: threonine ammonia-lyase [Methanolinea sp.]|jgi:threonine dehydratase|nr:threonine ammonia-lyase [Methanolinea sp.]